MVKTNKKKKLLRRVKLDLNCGHVLDITVQDTNAGIPKSEFEDNIREKYIICPVCNDDQLVVGVRYR